MLNSAFFHVNQAAIPDQLRQSTDQIRGLSSLWKSNYFQNEKGNLTSIGHHKLVVPNAWEIGWILLHEDLQNSRHFSVNLF